MHSTQHGLCSTQLYSTRPLQITHLPPDRIASRRTLRAPVISLARVSACMRTAAAVGAMRLG